MEWDYGAYHGRRTADIRAGRPGWRLFEDGCPGGETVEAVGARADRVIARIRACGRRAPVRAPRYLARPRGPLAWCNRPRRPLFLLGLDSQHNHQNSADDAQTPVAVA